MEPGGSGEETRVQSPEAAVAQARGCEQMRINPGDSFSEQPVLLQEAKNLVVIGRGGRRQALKIVQNLGPRSEIAAGDLSDDERVNQNMSIQERLA